MRKKNTMFRRKKLVGCSRRRQVTKQLHRKLTSRRQRYQTQLDAIDFSDIHLQDMDFHGANLQGRDVQESDLQDISNAAFEGNMSHTTDTTTGTEAI